MYGGLVGTSGSDSAVAIGGIVSGGTAGSILFVGAGSVLAQDNANLFFDDTNNRLGVGNTATVAAGLSAQSGDFLILGASGNNPGDRSCIRYTGGGYNSTPSAPNATSNGDKLVFYNDSTGKSAIGIGSGYDMWLQAGGTSTGVFVFYQGTTSILRYSNAAGWCFGATAATHTITLPSTATGISQYNTVDQTTNFERARSYWASNVFNISTEIGGAGVARNMAFGLSGNQMVLLSTALPFFQVNPNSTSGTTAPFIRFFSGTTGNATSGVQIGHQIGPTWNQSGTAGYTALDINVTETATGSGAKKAIDCRIAGTTNFSILNNGRIQYISGNTATTVGAAGGASALPATPTGYLLIDIGGTTFKVPYYAN